MAGPVPLLLRHMGCAVPQLHAVADGRIVLSLCALEVRPLDHRTDPPAFSPRVYKHRNRVERFFNRIKHFRAVATRFDRHDASFLASVKLAAQRIWSMT